MPSSKLKQLIAMMLSAMAYNDVMEYTREKKEKNVQKMRGNFRIANIIWAEAISESRWTYAVHYDTYMFSPGSAVSKRASTTWRRSYEEGICEKSAKTAHRQKVIKTYWRFLRYIIRNTAYWKIRQHQHMAKAYRHDVITEQYVYWRRASSGTFLCARCSVLAMHSLRTHGALRATVPNA